MQDTHVLLLIKPGRHLVKLFYFYNIFIKIYYLLDGLHWKLFELITPGETSLLNYP